MNTFEVAQTWRSLGISCLPILWGTKRPAISEWKPYQMQLPTERELELWFKDTNYSIAVIAGRGLVIADFDSQDAHTRWINSLSVKQLMVLNTYRVRTSRGIHYYWWVAEMCEEGHGEGVDIKARGYCLCPPSLHPSGVQYTGIGRIEDIAHIERIQDLLPDYKPISEWRQEQHNITPRDIWDEAMRPSLPSSGIAIEDIKAHIRVEDLLGLPRVTRTTHINCPLPGHNDTHASFVIYGGNDPHVYCFGCNRGGDVVSFYCLAYNKELGDAIRELAQKTG